ncbi:hypothetical protein N657DRAFT_122006 [Parathielavia appendiculata]|uniref:Uncharacterized protein n=1 Tax=Parathielavia appendiculata TaxID=2587402 RepID=A0AAN6TV18_9PEZI|nr:hypothetical protein N657DRAFT_122006 [Parathielavia appendiculata]
MLVEACLPLHASLHGVVGISPICTSAVETSCPSSRLCLAVPNECLRRQRYRYLKHKGSQAPLPCLARRRICCAEDERTSRTQHPSPGSLSSGHFPCSWRSTAPIPVIFRAAVEQAMASLFRPWDRNPAVSTSLPCSYRGRYKD